MICFKNHKIARGATSTTATASGPGTAAGVDNPCSTCQRASTFGCTANSSPGSSTATLQPFISFRSTHGPPKGNQKVTTNLPFLETVSLRCYSGHRLNWFSGINDPTDHDPGYDPCNVPNGKCSPHLQSPSAGHISLSADIDPDTDPH